MSKLHMAIGSLLETFDTYAGVEGKKDSLSKAEVKAMLEKELGVFLKGAQNQGEVEKMLKSLDFDGDSEVDFKEFMVLVTSLASVAHDCFHKK